MQIKFSKPTSSKSTTTVIFANHNMELLPEGARIDIKSGKNISKALKSANFKEFKQKFFAIEAPAKLDSDRVIVGNIGKLEELNELKAQSLGGALCNYLNARRIDNVNVIVDKLGKAKISQKEFASHMAYGLSLKSYRFDKYRTKEKETAKPTLKSVTFIVDNANETSRAFEELNHITEGVFLTRNLVSEPPNVIYPESFAKKCQELKNLGVKVEVLGEDQMKKLGMNSLLGVGIGSEKESQLVIMEWQGGKKGEKPIAFVGKGVTFDTGGISIKPANGMEDMKYDMAGAGAVTGLMKVLAGRKAKVNAVGVIGLVENMPSGSAQRPSDVVKSMSGQTIEVLNTDAEGRLVLADALWYCQDRFKPKFMIDLATLTGAIVVSLGSLYAGLFSNNDGLSEKLTKSGKKVGERLWRFPMGEEYDRQIDSDIADMQNTGNERGAGSITAAQFLERFVNKTPWAHLDIAGVAWAKKDLDTVPKGATGFGVRLLNQLIEDYYE